METFNRWCASYSDFTRDIKPHSLFLLALGTTAATGLLLPFSKVQIPELVYVVMVVTAISYLGFLFYITHSTPRIPPPPTPEPYPHLSCFCKGTIFVVSLLIFQKIDSYLESDPTICTPAICILCYFHVLIVLAIFNRRQDYGLSDGCLAAGFGVLSPMADSIPKMISLVIVTIILFGLRNLQFYTTIPLPQIPLPQIPLPQIPIQDSAAQNPNPVLTSSTTASVSSSVAPPPPPETIERKSV